MPRNTASPCFSIPLISYYFHSHRNLKAICFQFSVSKRNGCFRQHGCMVIYMCILFVCLCTDVGKDVHICVHMRVESSVGYLLQLHPILFVDTQSLTHLELTGQQAPGILTSLPPHCWDYRQRLSLWQRLASYTGVGDLNSVHMLVQEAFY